MALGRHVRPPLGPQRLRRGGRREDVEVARQLHDLARPARPQRPPGLPAARAAGPLPLAGRGDARRRPPQAEAALARLDALARRAAELPGGRARRPRRSSAFRAAHGRRPRHPRARPPILFEPGPAGQLRARRRPARRGRRPAGRRSSEICRRGGARASGQRRRGAGRRRRAGSASGTRPAPPRTSPRRTSCATEHPGRGLGRGGHPRRAPRSAPPDRAPADRWERRARATASRVGETLEVLGRGPRRPTSTGRMRARHCPAATRSGSSRRRRSSGSARTSSVSVVRPPVPAGGPEPVLGPGCSPRSCRGPRTGGRRRASSSSATTGRHISEETPIDVDFAESVNRLAGRAPRVGGHRPLAERIDELDLGSSGWQSVQERAQADGVEHRRGGARPSSGTMPGRALRRSRPSSRRSSRRRPSAESGRSAATARRLAELQSQYAGGAPTSASGTSALQRQLADSAGAPGPARRGALATSWPKPRGRSPACAARPPRCGRSWTNARRALDGLDPGHAHRPALGVADRRPPGDPRRADARRHCLPAQT